VPRRIVLIRGMPKLPSLAKIRLAQFMTQEELAEKADVARSTIAELEMQGRPARFRTMRKLATALGVQMEDLMAPE